jgi:Spy/CpxP family protein refolding chaperone
VSTGARNLLITLGLALLVAAAGAWACAHFVLMRHESGPSLHEVVHHDLKLTPAQERRIEAAEAAYGQRRKTLEAELRAANRELAEAMARDQQDSPAVQAAVDHVHHAMGALQKETIAHVFAMRRELTPVQAERFDREVARALTEDHR